MTQPELPINPFDPAFRIDPYPVYHRLRAEDPVHQSPFGFWILTRYDDCVAIAKDPRTSVDEKKGKSHAELVAQLGYDPTGRAFGGARPFLFLDPPDHTRLRRLVSKAFTPRVVEGLRPRIHELVEGMLDSVAEAGSMDVVADLAYPLPVTVISELLGVPAGDYETFRDWSDELARGLDPLQVASSEALDRELAVLNAFGDYLRGLIAERRTAPRDDLLSALVAAEDDGDKLTESELLMTCVLLLIAGHETTVNLIGNGAMALLRFPDQLDLLRRNPSLAPSAVEEFLRYDAPVQGTKRVMLDDVEIGGKVIPKGDQAILVIAAANRDPERFPDPDRLDITRADNHHLAFGFGIHHCLGAPLARVEGEIALTMLIGRFHDLQLKTDAPAYKENIVLRGLAQLPLAFAPVEAAVRS
jgi:cytochrome P450